MDQAGSDRDVSTGQEAQAGPAKEPTTRQEAAILIANLRSDIGGLTKEEEEATLPAVLKALKSVRRKLAASLNVIALELNSTKCHFIYELIQNADDNSYERAKERNEEPFIRFTVHPDRIVIDSNEDGFRACDVAAICSVKASTKETKQGYIGEKGIGFKSVFKAAKKVHIQSGLFSFAFSFSRKGDGDGLGMMTPMDEEYENLGSIQTRMTLTLLESPMTDENYDELFDIPDMLLLFLNKLKRIEIHQRYSGSLATSTTYRCSYTRNQRFAAITKEIKKGSSTNTERYPYWITEREVHGLPYDDLRKEANKATIVLAFPVDNKSQPIEATQQAFAFLPLRNYGFKFIIQADFVTQASREGIAASPRNKRLLEEVAYAFRDAVLRQFCPHPTLQYQWLKYLPDDSVSDEFWKFLKVKIIDLLKETKVLRSRSDDSLHKPGDLRILRKIHLDKDGEPLFRDRAQKNLYLALGYEDGSVTNLNTLGVMRLSESEVLDRVDDDLRDQHTSRLKSTIDEDWHTRAALLLMSCIGKATNVSMDRIRSLTLIPIQNGNWISMAGHPVYYPSTGSAEIPHDLGFNLVKSSAIENRERKKLFSMLGVTECSPNTVVERIWRSYSESGWKPSCPHLHLRYLFDVLRADATNIADKISIRDDTGEMVWLTPRLSLFGNGRLGSRMYFEIPGDPYGPGSLFREEKTNKNLLRQERITFIHPESAKNPSPDILRHGRTYEDWLAQKVGVRHIPCLVIESSESVCLSSEFMHILEHCPNKLVGLLRRHWQAYMQKLTPPRYKEVLKALKTGKVPTEGSGELIQLDETYLPLPSLRDIVLRAGVPTHSIFLELLENVTEECLGDWDFVKILGVGTHDDLNLYLTILRRQSTNRLRADWERILHVYSKIAERCSTDNHQTHVRGCFKEEALFCLPQLGAAGRVEWFRKMDCVWSGPEWLTVRRRLEVKYQDLRNFFCTTLQMRDANWRHAIMELEKLKAGSGASVQNVSKIYSWLLDVFKHHSSENASSFDPLRSEFEAKELVMDPATSHWHPPSTCVWAESRICIPQKVSIATDYAALEDFFVRMLAVPRPNVAMHVQTLLNLSKSISADAEWRSMVKDAMKLISGMDPKASDLAELRSANVFPVKTRLGVRPTNSQVEFAILDRQQYDGLFPDLHVLDFSFPEVHACQPFLKAMGLESKYMSALIEEKTEVEGGAIDPGMTRHLQSRAYALYRCAVNYHSPAARDGNLSLFRQLQEAETWETERISQALIIMQNGARHVSTKLKGNFHMHVDSSTGNVRLYVPVQKRDRERCYLRQVPNNLVHFLGIKDPKGEKIISDILQGRSLDVVDDILEEVGIIDVQGVDRPVEGDQSLAEETPLMSTSTALAHVRPPSPARSVTPVREMRPGTPRSNSRRPSSSYRTSPERDLQPSPSRFAPTPALQPFSSVPGLLQVPVTPPPSNQTTPSRTPTPPFDSNRYSALLDRIINAASRATMPRYGTSSFAAIRNTDHPVTPMFDYRAFERDFKVGAAGELFAFEFLSTLGLPGFGRENWQSVIRKHVQVHEKYNDLPEWHGRETADITYQQTNQEFDQILLASGYSISAVGNALCYIEVKTTTKDLSELFFVSRAQYERMHQARRPDLCIPTRYILIRVFNLESANIGLRIYVDPISAKERGELAFEAESWNVQHKEVAAPPPATNVPAHTPGSNASRGRPAANPLLGQVRTDLGSTPGEFDLDSPL